MSTAATTSHDTGQTSSRRIATNPTNNPTTQLERSAANRLCATMAAVRLAFTWLGVRKILAPEQRTTAAQAFHADRELLDVLLVRAAQNVVLVAVTAGDTIKSLRRLALKRCLLVYQAGVYSRSEGVSGGWMRRLVREPGVN